MKLFDKIKKSANDFNLNNELVSKAKRGELDGFTDSDREFFIQEHHQTPEKYKEDYDNGQADKEIARALRKHDHMAFVNPALRKDIDGYYYFGSFYKKDTPKYYLVGFKWDGARYKSVASTHTTGKNKTKGRMGSVLVGGVLLGPLGAFAGSQRGRKTKIDQTAVTTTDTKEVKTKGLLFFIDKDTKERKAKSVLCDSAVEEKIYNLNFVSEEVALSENPIGISDRLMEAKRLLEKKEITKEEFDAKLNSILH